MDEGRGPVYWQNQVLYRKEYLVVMKAIGTACAMSMVCLGVFAVDAGPELQSSVVWLDSAPYGTQVYAAFRKVVEIPAEVEGASLHIFADSRYMLWVNGAYAERGPCRFDPAAPEYDTLDVSGCLKPGRNVVALLVHHYHDGKADEAPEEFCGRIMRHQPGVAVKLEVKCDDGAAVTVGTDPSWRGTMKTRFLPSAVSWGSIPDSIDARLDDGDWTIADYDDSDWEYASPVDGTLWGPFRPRAIPPLKETPFVPQTLVMRSEAPDAVARPLTETLPLTIAAGQYAVLDVGRSVLAYDVLDFEAEAGTTLEILHGSGWRDGNLDEAYHPNRYTARAGRQTYMAGDTFGFRYMRIRVEGSPIVLHGVTVVNRVYPFERVGRFSCSDAYLNELWERSIRTVELCSEDGYTDCSTRERVEWMGDAALSEYPISRVIFAGPGPDGKPICSDPRLARNILWHIALSQQEDGRVKAHHPSNRWDIHGYIEDYSCLWIHTLRNYYDNTGDLEFVREVWPNVVKQLNWFLAHRTERGLVKAREFVFFGNPLAYKVCEGTTLNAYVSGALLDAAFLAEALGETASAERLTAEGAALRESINTHLWDGEAKTYYGGIMDGEKTPLTAYAAMTALYFGVVSPEHREDVLRWLVDHHDQVVSPFEHFFVFEALYGANDPALDTLALNIMRSKWASTLARKDLDTVFEGFGGGALCHNMGAPAAYFLSTRVLGVRREGTLAHGGIVVEPRPGDLTEAQGVVMTELGPVAVSWNRGEEVFTLRVELPHEATVIVPTSQPGEVETEKLEGAGVQRMSPYGNGVLCRVGPGECVFKAPR